MIKMPFVSTSQFGHFILHICLEQVQHEIGEGVCDKRPILSFSVLSRKQFFLLQKNIIQFVLRRGDHGRNGAVP